MQSLNSSLNRKYCSFWETEKELYCFIKSNMTPMNSLTGGTMNRPHSKGHRTSAKKHNTVIKLHRKGTQQSMISFSEF